MKYKTHWFEKICYEKSLEKQNYLRKLTEQNSHYHIMGVEYNPVITIGIRGNHDDILDSDLKNIPVFKIKRGGQTTIHNPGQIVIYPIVPIKKLKIKIKQFIDIIINCTTQTMGHFGCQTEFDQEKKGFYTTEGKIGFLGLQFKKGVSMHGLSINISNNLNIISKIKSCGIINEKFDKLTNHNNKVTIKDIFDKWSDEFINLLQNLTYHG